MGVEGVERKAMKKTIDAEKNKGNFLMTNL